MKKNNTQKQLNEYSSDLPSRESTEKNHDNGEEIILKKTYGDIPFDVQDNDYLSVFREADRNIHNIALYPCKYIAELPKWAILKYSKKGDYVLDPFIGSGTTFVECIKSGRNCLGIDYNPYAQLVSTVKSTKLDSKKLKEEYNQLISNIKLDKDVPPQPNFKGVDFWFNKNVIRALSRIKKHTNQVKDKKYKDFFLVVFSMVVRKSSYIAPGQILTARRNDWREIKQLTEQETIEMFESVAEEYMNYMNDFSKDADEKVHTEIIGIDSKEITLPSGVEKVDLMVGSPPYINAMDYIWANRLRLHWLDLVKDDADRLDLYNHEIGTERIPKKEYDKIGKTGIAEIDKKIEEIYKYNNSDTQSKLRSRVTYKYFMDMKKHLESAYSVLKKGGRYCIVVGDNNIRKVYIPTSEFLIKIAESIGFEKEMKFQIILKNRSMNVQRNVDFANEIKYDRMIVLKKV